MMAASMGRTEAVNILLSRGAVPRSGTTTATPRSTGLMNPVFTDSEKALRDALKPTTASRR